MKTITKQAVVAKLVKTGVVEADAIKAVEKHYDYAVDKYSTNKKIVEVIWSLGI